MIPITFPFNFLPIKAEFFDFDCINDSSKINSLPLSNKVRLAGAPSFISGIATPKTFLGAMVKRSTTNFALSTINKADPP